MLTLNEPKLISGNANKNLAKDFAVSVFPIPVDPKNIKVPKGLDGSLKPALERIIVFEIADKT